MAPVVAAVDVVPFMSCLRRFSPLRPLVHPPTHRYNMKLRLGRGFTIEEIKGAGLTRKVAQSIGIAVDGRRKNKSLESLQLNVQRIKEYQSKLILFPVKAGKKDPNGLTTADEATQRSAVQLDGALMPVGKINKRIRAVSKKDVDAARAGAGKCVVDNLRRLRADAKYDGARKERARLAAEAKK